MASVIGIDPGLSGALALITDNRLITAIDMPVWNLHGKNCVDTRELETNIWELIHHEDAHNDPLIVLEKAQPVILKDRVPSPASQFSFGRTFGMIEAICWGTGLKVHYIRAGDWKRKAILLKAPKDASLDRARQLFPERADLFTRKKDHDRAEAALIGHYGAP